jgi:hypothetical protein
MIESVTVAWPRVKATRIITGLDASDFVPRHEGQPFHTDADTNYS